MGKLSKIWASSMVLRRGVVTLHSSVGPRHGVACPRCGVAEKEAWPASGTLQRSDATPWRKATMLCCGVATVHSM